MPSGPSWRETRSILAAPCILGPALRWLLACEQATNPWLAVLFFFYLLLPAQRCHHGWCRCCCRGRSEERRVGRLGPSSRITLGMRLLVLSVFIVGSWLAVPPRQLAPWHQYLRKGASSAHAHRSRAIIHPAAGGSVHGTGGSERVGKHAPPPRRRCAAEQGTKPSRPSSLSSRRRLGRDVVYRGRRAAPAACLAWPPFPTTE